MKEPKKEMLSISYDSEKQKHIVKINYSSLEVLQTCLRKGFYLFERELVKNVKSPPLVFGSAVHRAMEIWYCAPFEARKELSPECQDAQADIVYGHLSDAVQHGRCARCSAVFGFVEEMGDLKFLEDNDKRSVSNGVEILNDYFSTNLPDKDPFEIYSDDLGPCIERRVEFNLYSSSDLEIDYFGTIDAIWKQNNTGKLYIVDHKTTASLGRDFMLRHRPNFQYSGYIFGAQRTLQIDTEAFIVNGIQVAKTVRSSKRIFTFREANDLVELRNAVVHNVKRWLEAKEETNIYPMNCPNPCTMYGGCPYHDVCAATESVREPIIRSLYEVK